MNSRKLLIMVILLALAAGGIFLTFKTTGKSHKTTVAIFNLMSHPILDASATGVKEGLAAAGYGSDQLNIVEVNANGEMDKLNAFAIELLAAHPDVIVPISTPVTQAVFKEASKSQHIVFSTVTNPNDVGMNQNPSNMTGVCDSVNYESNFDLIFELFPNVKTIGIIYNAGESNSQYGVLQIQSLAKRRGIELKLVTVSQTQEVADAARSLIGSVDVFYVGSDNTVVAAMAALTKVAYEKNVPVLASDLGSVQEGALAAVSVDYTKLGRRAGALAAQVLKTGELPKDHSPVMFLGDQLVLNEKAAKQLHYDFPVAVRDRANDIVR